MSNIFKDLFTKTIRSKLNGTLELTWLKGKKVLNSENANYSYGALETVLNSGLQYARADRSAEILILGMGGGSVIKLLRNKYRYSGKITAVEIDPVIIKIAEEEFKIREHEPLDIICGEAGEYVKQGSAQFGLIIIDLFFDLQVPLHFYSEEFWKHIPRLLKNNGIVIFNAGIDSANQKETERLLKGMKTEITFRKLTSGTNTLLLGRKN